MSCRFLLGASSLFLFVLLGACPASGALQAYLKVGDIEGGSTEEHHEGWSKILTYDMSVQNSGWQPGPHGTSPPLFSDMYVTKLTDLASPYFWKGVWSGEHFDEATIDVIDIGVGPPPDNIKIRWRFEDVVLSAYNAVFDDLSAELVAIDYGKISYVYNFSLPNQVPVGFTYNRETNMQELIGTVSSGFDLVTQFAASPAPEPTSALLAGIAALAGTFSRRARRRGGTEAANSLCGRRAS